MCVDDESILSADGLFLTSGAADVLTYAMRQHLKGLFDYSGAGPGHPRHGSLADVIAYPLWLAMHHLICPGWRSALGWDRINDPIIFHSVAAAIRNAITQGAK